MRYIWIFLFGGFVWLMTYAPSEGGKQEVAAQQMDINVEADDALEQRIHSDQSRAFVSCLNKLAPYMQEHVMHEKQNRCMTSCTNAGVEPSRRGAHCKKRNLCCKQHCRAQARKIGRPSLARMRVEVYATSTTVDAPKGVPNVQLCEYTLEWFRGYTQQDIGHAQCVRQCSQRESLDQRHPQCKGYHVCCSAMCRGHDGSSRKGEPDPRALRGCVRRCQDPNDQFWCEYAFHCGPPSRSGECCSRICREDLLHPPTPTETLRWSRPIPQLTQCQ